MPINLMTQVCSIARTARINRENSQFLILLPIFVLKTVLKYWVISSALKSLLEIRPKLARVIANTLNHQMANADIVLTSTLTVLSVLGLEVPGPALNVTHTISCLKMT
jgi:hypothetical protein